MFHQPICFLLILLFSSTAAFKCGLRKWNINVVIVRGQPTFHGDWPWHAAIYHLEDNSESYACGGTVISELYVLTADHCVRDKNEAVLSNKRMLVRLGLHYLRDLNPKKFQQHKVNKILIYKGKDQLRNDIAILELGTVIEFTEFVQPACLNQEEDLTRQFGTAVGWGFDETGVTSPILKSQRMPVVSTNKCLESNDGLLRAVLDSSIICAGYLNGTTVCNGDSGGGLHFERKGVWYVGAIVSFTLQRDGINRCHLKSYAGFTDVHHFLPWIRNVTGLGLVDESAGKKIYYKTDQTSNILFTRSKISSQNSNSKSIHDFRNHEQSVLISC